MEALLVILGVLVPASVTLVGYWAKRQSELRLTEERSRAERRLELERAEEADRLRLDASMRAAALLEPADGTRASGAAAASALLALTGLGQADLAVALLVDRWQPSGGTGASGTGRENVESVSTEAAILVIDEALRSVGDASAQLIAAELLCRHAASLDPCQSLHWPSSVDGRWVPELSTRAKLLVMDGLVQMTVSSGSNENALRATAVRLWGVWAGDPSAQVKGCVGTLIAALLPQLEALGYEDLMQGQEVVRMEDLRAAASSAHANPDGFLERLVSDRARALVQWAAGCSACDYSPGALAAR